MREERNEMKIWVRKRIQNAKYLYNWVLHQKTYISYAMMRPMRGNDGQLTYIQKQ